MPPPLRGSALAAVAFRMGMSPLPVLVLVPSVQPRIVTIVAVSLGEPGVIGLVLPSVPDVIVLVSSVVHASLRVCTFLLRGS